MKAKYKELSDLAFSLQKQNKLDEALQIYQNLLKTNPEDVNVLNLTGMIYMSKRNYEESINFLSKAAVLNPTAYIVSNLAKAYYLNKQYENSIELYHKAISIEPSDDIYYSLGLAYKSVDDNENALKYYTKALEFNQDNYNAYYNLAILYRDLNNSQMAIDFCLKAKKINATDVDLYTLLSSLYENVQDYELAIENLKIALMFKPDNHLCYYNIAVLYSKLDMIDNAIAYYLKVLEYLPNDLVTLINLSYLYKDQKNLDLALNYALKAYELNKKSMNVIILLSSVYRDLFDNENSLKVLNDYLKTDDSKAEIYYQIALNKMDICLYSEAMECYEKALSIEPKNLSYLKGKAIAYKYLGKEDIAFEMFKEIYDKDGHLPATAISLGMCYLKNKDFYNGMQYYSQRSTDTKFAKIFKEKVWNKSVDLKDKSILLYSDCGLGDTVMFARYLPMLNNLVSSITIQTDAELVSLLKQSYPNINIISKTQPRPDYDVVMPIMDISYALNSDFNEIPCTDEYLSVDNKKVNEFKKLDIFQNSDLKIGICYQGNKKVLKNRFIDTDSIKTLLSIPNATFYSFQLNTQIDGAINLSEYIKDYSDTSALLKCIDILVTIDSSIVHVAGALGVKTILMLPKTAEWRWFDDSNKSSWYNSVEIYRQVESNNWDSVLLKVKDNLIRYANK